jgi:hypothetical protein
MLTFYQTRIAGSKKHRIPDHGSGSATLLKVHNLSRIWFSNFEGWRDKEGNANARTEYFCALSVTQILALQYPKPTHTVPTDCKHGLLIFVVPSYAVLRIRDGYPGSPDPNFFPSRIQGQKDSGSRIQIRIKEFKHF